MLRLSKGVGAAEPEDRGYITAMMTTGPHIHYCDDGHPSSKPVQWPAEPSIRHSRAGHSLAHINIIPAHHSHPSPTDPVKMCSLS